MRHWLSGFVICFFLAGVVGVPACKHAPTVVGDDEFFPPDTTDMPTDTMPDPVDTSTLVPCESDVVYFKYDVLPIFVSNCAFSGCHDAASAEDGVILTNYADAVATADVEPFDLGDSELYEVITEDDPDKRMPPPPAAPLTQAQIQVISAWILQGAQDLDCDPEAGECDTDNVSYAQTVRPVIQTHCQGCHSGNPPAGGIDLSTHAGVETVADNGRLYGAIAHLDGFSPMPQGGNKLPDCTIEQIESWVNAGAPNN